MTSDDTPADTPTDYAVLEGEPLEDLEPDTDEAAGIQGGWRRRGEEPEEEELQM